MEVAIILKETVEEDAKLLDNFNYMQQTMEIITKILFLKSLGDFPLIKNTLINKQLKNNDKFKVFIIYKSN